MSTTRTFNAMLNEHLNYDLLKEELTKRVYILTKVEKDNDWKGGTLPVPFKGSGASSVSFGQLTASNDIAQDAYVRGQITSQPEVWGSLIFNQRDIWEHDGKVKESSFLKLLPDAIDDFMDYMKMVVSLSFTNGSYFATVNVDGTAGGVLGVDRIERFVIGQKVGLQGTVQALAYYYVIAIDMGTSKITLSATRGGVAVTVAVYTVADAAKVYFDGSATSANQLTALKASLLSAANGGSSTLYGQTKTAYPFLQAINVDGSGVTASNILAKLFDGFTTIRNRGKGNPTSVLMSFKHLGSVLKALETNKGAYNIVQGSEKVNVYGWTEVMVTTVKGTLNLVGVQEMDDDWMPYMDWRALKLHTNGFFKKRVSPDGLQYFEVRNQTGFQYIVDLAFFGDLVLNRPSYCGIMYGISY